MGFLSINYTIVANDTNEIVSSDLGPGTLLALSAVIIEDGPTLNEMFLQIGILSGGNTLDQRAAILAAGYAGVLNAIAWTGLIPIADDSRFYALVQGQTGDSFRLIALVAPVDTAIPPGVRRV